MRWSLSGAGLALVAVGVAALLFADAGAAQSPPSATSRLVALTIVDAPELGISGHTGSYGIAGTPDTSQPASADPGDFSDPDNLLERGTVTGAPTSRTSWAELVNQLTAQAQFAGITFGLAGAPDFLAIGAIDAFVSCAPPRFAPVAFLRLDANQLRVLGTNVGPGNSTVDVTGARLGLSSFETGTLTVTVTIVEQTPTPSSARARLEVSVTGTFQDAAGATVYEGPVFDLVAGDVTVDCETDQPTPTPSATATPSPTLSPTPPRSPTLSPSPSPTRSPTLPPSPSPSPSPTPTASESPGPGPTLSPPEPAPPAPPHPTSPPLPPTGVSAPVTWGALSILAGTAMVLVAALPLRRRLRT